MKIIFALCLFSSFSLFAADLKCGSYQMTGTITNGKTNTLYVQQNAREEGITFFLDGNCPTIVDGTIKGKFKLTSKNPLTVKCSEKTYLSSKGNHQMKLIKKEKCSL